MFEHYLAIAQPWLDQYGYFALFVSVFLEAFGMPTPGESLIVASSLLAGRGDMHIVPILLSAWLAAVLGDNTGYLIGRWGGRHLLHTVGVKPEHLAKAERFFKRYGGGIVIIARFFPVLRQLNGVVAGSMQMPWWRFLSFNMLGAALWVGFWGGGVYWLGGHFEQIEQAFQGVVPYTVAVGLAALAGLVWYLKPWARGQ